MSISISEQIAQLTAQVNELREVHTSAASASSEARRREADALNALCVSRKELEKLLAEFHMLLPREARDDDRWPERKP